jgi:hypothetical protein
MTETNERASARPAAPEAPAKSFDPFELIVAILLGLGATGGAISAYQGDLWGGQSIEAYGEASTQATNASSIYNEAVGDITYDMNVDVEAKRLIIEGLFTEDPLAKTRAYTIASYLYGQQLSDPAYEVTGLNPRYREAEARGDMIPEEELSTTLDRELYESEEYEDAMLRDGLGAFAESDAMFDRGRAANETGDEFAFMGVLFTVALFLAGIALVFKTNIRWGFAGMGLVVLMYAAFQLFTTPWAGGDPPAAEAEEEAEEEPAEEEAAEEEAAEE